MNSKHGRNSVNLGFESLLLLQIKSKVPLTPRAKHAAVCVNVRPVNRYVSTLRNSP